MFRIIKYEMSNGYRYRLRLDVRLYRNIRNFIKHYKYMCTGLYFLFTE